MFDWIDDVELPCPLCKKMIKGFQTKDLGKVLGNYMLSEIPARTSMFSFCDACNTSITIRKGEFK